MLTWFMSTTCDVSCRIMHVPSMSCFEKNILNPLIQDYIKCSIHNKILSFASNSYIIHRVGYILPQRLNLNKPEFPCPKDAQTSMHSAQWFIRKRFLKVAI